MLIDKIANRNPYKYTNPMEKFIFSVGLLIFLTYMNNYYLDILNIIFINIFLIKLVKIKMRELYNLYKVVLFFMFMTSISLIIMGNDFLRLNIHAFSSVGAMYFLFCTTPVTQIAEVMLNLKMPRIIVELFLLIYRFIFLFVEIKNQMINSQNARLGSMSLKISYKSFGLLVSSLFNKVLILSEKTNTSVNSRLGTEFIFLRSQYKTKSKFKYFFVYLIILIVVGVYDKI